MNILVADDDPIWRRTVRSHLMRLGYHVREVSDGEQAWNIMQQEPIPILITDWVMPGLSGLELIRLIRNTAFPGYTYIILLTAKDDRTDVVAGLDAGADDYLSKPFNHNELRARVAIAERIVSLEARLREARDTDILTNLSNRRAITAAAAIEMARAQRESRSMSVIMLDVDHFKQVNDTYGHPVGDRALILIAKTIKSHVRPYDIVGRWGGEELIVLLPNTTSAEAALVAERVRVAIESTPLTLETGQQMRLTASFGVASSAGAPDCSFDTLVQLADIGLYQAKQGGRNRVAVAAGT